MAAKLEFQPYISVITAFGDPCSFLFITISVFPRFPSGWDGGFATLNTHNFSATVEGSQELALVPDIRLSPAIVPTPRWEACGTICVASLNNPWDHENAGRWPMVWRLRWRKSPVAPRQI